MNKNRNPRKLKKKLKKLAEIERKRLILAINTAILASIGMAMYKIIESKSFLCEIN
jgi:hypothetical protein